MVVITDAPAFPAMMASDPLARRKTLAESVVWMDAAGRHVRSHQPLKEIELQRNERRIEYPAWAGLPMSSTHASS
jgi:hypothetical protein